MKRTHNTNDYDGGKRIRTDQQQQRPYSSSSSSSSHMQVAIPQSKYQGFTGRKVLVTTNYFRVSLAGSLKLFLYHLEITPPVEARSVRGGLLSNLKEKIGDFIPFAEQLYLLRDLPEGLEDDVTSIPKNGQEGIRYHISIRPIQNNTLSENALHVCLNSLFKKLMRAKKWEQIGACYFDPRNCGYVQKNGSNIWPGFKTAVMKLEMGNYLMAELKHKVLRLDTTVYSVIRKMNQQQANAAFNNTRVCTSYNRKPYLVTRIEYDRDMHNTIFEDFKTGTKMSVFQYMEQRYPNEIRRIRDHKQPLIVSEITRRATGHTRVLYLIPELCYMTGLSDEMRSDFHLMTDFKKHTLVAPSERLKKLDELIRSFSDPQLRLKEIAQLRSWNVEVSTKPMEIIARELPDQLIYMRAPDTQKNVPVTTRVGDWAYELQANTKNNYLFQTNFKNGNSANWVIVYPARYNASRLEGEIIKLAHKFGLNLGALDNDKKFSAVCAKIVTQILAKLGGAPWIMNLQELDKRGKFMFVGIDLSHNVGKPSTVGMVASLNRNMSSYYSRVYSLGEGIQAVDQIGKFIEDAVSAYRKLNEGHPPATLIIYRDGAGESQMRATIDLEYNQLMNAFKKMGLPIEIVYILVQKRLNTRFFKNGNNVVAGTIVDSGVTATRQTHQELTTDFDFYLVSQSHMQGTKEAAGTMNPTRYWVRYPNMDQKGALSVNDIQLYTYQLCHLFFNWPGTVSTPAISKYAKVLATMAGKVLSNNTDVNPRLYTKLHYI